jgi:hypothetical protein
MGRPFIMPPDTPKELVNTIRRAFDATMKDPVFLAEAAKSLFDVDPLSGEEMEQILKRAYATPKNLVQRAAEFNGSGGVVASGRASITPSPAVPAAAARNRCAARARATAS